MRQARIRIEIVLQHTSSTPSKIVVLSFPTAIPQVPGFNRALYPRLARALGTTTDATLGTTPTLVTQ